MKRIVICLIIVCSFVGVANAQTKSMTGTVVDIERGMYKWGGIVIKVGNKKYLVYTFSGSYPTPKIVGKVEEVGRTVQVFYTKIEKGAYDGEVIATRIVEVKTAARPITPRGAAADSVESIYTNLSGGGCSPDRQVDIVEWERKCPGVSGYSLLVENVDDRASVTVVTPSGRSHPLNYPGTISGTAFSHLGERAEWRVTRRDGSIIPIALVIRVNVQSSSSNRPTSYLAVSKITQQRICVTNRINPSARANEQARRVADVSANRPCMRD